MRDDEPPVEKGPPSKPVEKKNIESQDAERPRWQPDKQEESLESLFRYVVEESRRSEAWYWKHKAQKALGSHLVQWTAVFLTGLAGITPIVVRLGLFPALGAWMRQHELIRVVDSGLLASLCIGVSGALIAFDRASGLSSGWARYVLTGSAIRSACEEFRMDWTALRAELGSTPKPELVASMIQRAKTFRMAVEALVMKETQDWATEFQNNLAQMEKDLKGQVEQARVAREEAERQAEKREQDKQEQAKQAEAERVAALRPGSLEATVVNAAETDDFSFKASLQNADGVNAFEETIQGAQGWARVGVPPGQYKLTIRAQVKKRSVASALVIAIKAGEKSEAKVTLPSLPAPPAGP